MGNNFGSNLTVSQKEITTIKAGTTVNGIISDDTEWTPANNPYLITGNVLIEENIVLTVQPGVVITFDGDYYIRILGTLHAQGTLENPIHINTSSYCHFQLNFREPSQNNFLAHCIVNGCADNTFLFVEKVSLSLFNSSFLNCDQMTYQNSEGVNFQISGNFFNNSKLNIDYCKVDEVIIQNNRFDSVDRCLTVLNNEKSITVLRNTFKSNSLAVFLDNMNGENGVVEYIENTVSSQETCIAFNLPTSTRPTTAQIIKNNNLTSQNRIFDIIGSPKVDIQYNNFNCSNLVFDLANWYTIENQEIYAPHNWWGTTDPSEIEAKINDYYDDFDLGKVIFEPFSLCPIIDSDSDGLLDGDELNIYFTNSTNPDTDGDGYLDGEEIQLGSDPLDIGDPLPELFPPNNISFNFDETNRIIEWVIRDPGVNVTHYWIYENRSLIQEGVWISNIPIIYNISTFITGTHIVDFIANDGYCSNITNSVTIIIIPDLEPEAHIQWNSDSIYYVGDEISFSSVNTSGNDPIIIQWDFGDGTPSQTGEFIVHIYLSEGNYTLTLTIVDNDGDEVFQSINIEICVKIQTTNDNPAYITSSNPFGTLDLTISSFPIFPTFLVLLLGISFLALNIRKKFRFDT